MDESLKAAIQDLALDKGTSLNAWLDGHPDTALPWVERCHVSFTGWLEQQRRPLQDLVDHRDGTRLASNRLLAGLGRDIPKEDIDAIGIDAKRYLGWLGFRNLHLLHIGPVPPQPPTLPADIHTGYVLARQLQSVLRTILHQQHYGKQAAFTPEEHLAALAISLALQDGVLSPTELKAALTEIERGRIYRLDNLWFVQSALDPDGGHVRRLFLGPVSLGLALSLPHDHFPDGVAKALARTLRKVPRDWLPLPSKPLTMTRLLAAGETFFRMQSGLPHHIVDYMTGKLVSDSLSAERLAQLFGKQPLAAQTTPNAAPTPPGNLPRARQEKPQFDRPGLINELKRALDPTRTPDARNTALALIQQHQVAGVKPAVAQVLDWVEWMLKKRGLKPSTALINLTALSQHLMPQLQSLDQTIDSPEEWERLFEEMTVGLKPQDKLFDAIRLMAQFLESRHHQSFSHAGGSSRALVNARVLSEAEVAGAINLLHQRLPEARAVLAEQLVMLGFHLGCRRWELLGMQPADVSGAIDPLIDLHGNGIRDLKTLASRRLVSLKFVMHEKFYDQWRNEVRKRADLAPDDSIFQVNGFDVRNHEKALFLEINKALQQASNNPEVSFHSLRHSAACRGLLGLYWRGLALQDLEAYPYFQEIASRAIGIEATLVQRNLADRFEHEAVSHQLGHLHFDTTAAHYFHFYCLLRYGHARRLQEGQDDMEAERLCLAAAGMTRQSRAIRKLDTLTPEVAFDILETRFSHRMQAYRETEEVARIVDVQATKPLLDELRSICELAKRAPDDRENFLTGTFPDEASRKTYLAALNQRIADMEAILTKAGRMGEPGRFSWDMPDSATAKSCIFNMIANIDPLKLSEPPEELKKLSGDLKNLAGFLGRQLNGAFRFKTGKQAQQHLSCLSTLLHSCPISFEAYIEKSRRHGGTVIKEKSDIMRITDPVELSHDGVGSLVVRIKNGSTSGWFKPSAFFWMISALYVAYGKNRLS